MTYSIVARDPDTGEFGVAVQTKWLAVGAVVPWLEPGVGAVATQSFVEVAYGPRLLERLRGGAAPAEALAALLADDPQADVRQVGVVDARGRAAGHTGARCVREASNLTRENLTCQANMMERPTVPTALQAGYDRAAADGLDLPARLMAALRAAEAEGGDVRGRQSAALVVTGPPGADPWVRKFDIRVDDHPAPLDELARLLQLARAFATMDEGDNALAVGDRDAAAAFYMRGLELAPDDDQAMVLAAGGLVQLGRFDEAAPLLRKAKRVNARWPEFVRRFSAAGHAPPVSEDQLRELFGD
ncbi:MAG TPA: DUF1028 domain-containing protein [Candidatus Polarisedimenticolia bacterium]|nr:DUF1028 domain-containing protein [Candidatus Polarisedimenticolia bacterium]